MRIAIIILLVILKRRERLENSEKIDIIYNKKDNYVEANVIRFHFFQIKTKLVNIGRCQSVCDSY